MQDPFDFTTILFALLALFVIWKLRSVLGSKDGFDQKQDTPPAQNGAPQDQPSNVVRLPGKGSAMPAAAPDYTAFGEAGSAVLLGLEQIKAADKRFEPAGFLDGARAAHEMILQAFATGDLKTLKSLLNEALFSSFSSAIAARDAKAEKLETTLISQEKSKFESAQLNNNEARITVRFRTKMITVTRDKLGTIIDGSADEIADVQDVWSFARDITARDPNWKLVATLEA